MWPMWRYIYIWDYLYYIYGTWLLQLYGVIEYLPILFHHRLLHVREQRWRNKYHKKLYFVICSVCLNRMAEYVYISWIIHMVYILLYLEIYLDFKTIYIWRIMYLYNHSVLNKVYTCIHHVHCIYIILIQILTRFMYHVCMYVYSVVH
jgi:hypothetical protein